MARNNVQTTVTVGMDVQLAKRNAEALKSVIMSLKNELKEQQKLLDNAKTPDIYKKISADIDELILKIKTLQKVQRSATPATAYESFISGDVMNSNTLRQAQRGAKNRLNTVNEFAGDKTARQFLNDIDKAQMRLNRLQAGFTKPLQSVKKELNDLSGGELKRLLTLLQQEQSLVQGNEKAWASYSVAIAKVEERMREYDTLARQQVGAQTLSRSQTGGFAQANERDIQRAIEKLREYRTVINDPNNTGKETWEATTREILKLQTTLDTLKQKAAEMKGEAMSIDTARNIGLQAADGTFGGNTKQLALAKKTLEEQLLLVERGTQEYKRLQKAIQGCEMEEKRMGMTAKEVQAVLDHPKGKSMQELKIAIEQGRIALSKMRTETDADKKKFDELAAKVKECDVQLKQLGGSAKGTASAFDKAWSRLKTYIGLYVGAAVAMQKLTQTMGDLMDLSDKMGEVRKTTGFSADEVGRLTENLKKMDTRTSINGLLDLSVAAGQLGLKTQEDVMGFTEAANKLMVALPEMGREGATEMLKVALATGEIDKIRKQMDQGLIEGSSATAVAMEKVGSTIDRLRATSAATAPAITDFVKRVGAVGAQSGISIDQVAALGSTVDALGMRVEMSATALSRMIPAIKNNAFDIAQILKVEPNTIRALYDTGHAMDVILMILEKMQGQDADTIEAMLGKGGMQELMKELNQQGARAGIVFGGLSQNVEELRRQLGVAAQAYEENIAIQQEYDKMNETTAAKWERLKNQIEEIFVGDTTQRGLGVIVDTLRWIVDFISGNLTPAMKVVSDLFHVFLVYWGVFKIGLGEGLIKAVGGLNAMGSSLANLITNTRRYITYQQLLTRFQKELAVATTAVAEAEAKQKIAAVEARMAQEGLNKAMIANVWMAVIAAVGMLVWKLYDWAEASREGAKEAARFEAELQKEQQKVEDLADSIGQARVKTEDANQAVEKARVSLEAVKRANDGTAESVNRLTKAESELLAKEEQKKKAMAEHKRLIEEFNSQYSKYLGYMLSEVSSNIELAKARDLVNAKLRETLALKRREAGLERIEKQYGEERDDRYADVYSTVHSLTDSRGARIDETTAARLLNDVTKAANSARNGDDFVRRTNAIFKRAGYGVPKYLARDLARYFWSVEDIRKQTQRLDEQISGEQSAARYGSQEQLRQAAQAGITNYNNLLARYNRSTGDAKKRAAADLLMQMDTMTELVNNASSYYDMGNSAEAGSYQFTFGRTVEPWLQNKKKMRSTLLSQAGNLYQPRRLMTDDGTGNGFTPSRNYTSGVVSSLYGEDIDPESTEYSTWNVDQLVARYRQMDDFKNVLRDGVDIEKVLAEDAALQAAIRRGEVDPTNWHSAQAWYESERKKIQRELRSEHNSGTSGHWIDEKTKKGRKRRNLFHESDWALAELDRYYSRRKETLEKARAEENISEELFNRQAELLEQEHLQKRSDLRRVFTETLTEEETKAFKAWWASLSDEKVRELEAVDWETIQKEWRRANNAQLGENNLKAQKDLTEMQSITVKHLNKVAKIVAKERPYDGIVDNLRSTLTEMGILFADMESEAVGDIEAMARVQARRLSFLIENAEQAYSMTVEDLLTKMREAGLTGWAQSIEQDDTMKYSLLAALHKAYDAVQDAIKKESSQIKKQVENIWNDAVDTLPNNMSRKDAFENAMAMLGLEEERVSGANSLIGAGYASENVAEKLAIKQMQISLAQQEHYFNLIRAQGLQRIDTLRREAEYERSIEKSLSEQAQKARETGDEERARVLMQDAEVHAQQALSAEFDAQHAATALNLATAEEQKKLDEQRVAIAKKLDESYGRLYKHLREWGELLSSSLLSVMEAGSAGNAEYYNERAKMRLTGKGGPGAGTYIVIDNEGTSGATAHYEYLDEEEALRRQHEIEQENARAEAWKKVMDDINMKMSEMITDKLNAMLQNTAVDANTQQVIKNTEELARLNANVENLIADRTANMTPAPEKKIPHTTVSVPEPPVADNGQQLESNGERVDAYGNPIEPGSWLDKALGSNPDITEAYINAADRVDVEIEADNRLTEAVVDNAIKRKQAQIESHKASTASAISSDNKEQASTEAKFAAMAQAANLYGIAYQTMSNDNLSTAQKFEMFALQAAGQAAISMLTMDLAKSTADEQVKLPGILGKLLGEMPLPAAMAAFAGITALMGGLMAMAVSSVSKSKSQISQVSGASASAGRLATGMQTYAEGNVNEFTDPGSLTQGRQYSVDGADGKTYRARYMGSNPKTHLTNGPEFHLVGEAGREAIIDARTTRLIRMNEPEIWRSIQTLYNGGSLRHAARRGRGVRTFADGNIGEMDNGEWMMDNGMSFDPVAMQASLDRNSAVQEALLERLNRPIYARNILYGPEGLPNVIAKLQKEAQRHGERYL